MPDSESSPSASQHFPYAIPLKNLHTRNLAPTGRCRAARQEPEKWAKAANISRKNYSGNFHVKLLCCTVYRTCVCTLRLGSAFLKQWLEFAPGWFSSGGGRKREEKDSMGHSFGLIDFALPGRLQNGSQSRGSLVSIKRFS